jgi:hypothetical protein
VTVRMVAWQICGLLVRFTVRQADGRSCWMSWWLSIRMAVWWLDFSQVGCQADWLSGTLAIRQVGCQAERLLGRLAIKQVGCQAGFFGYRSGWPSVTMLTAR